MTDAATLAGTLGAAAAPAVLLAFVLGARDAFIATRRNSFVRIGDYLWVYVAIPIVALTVLVLPLGAVVALGGFAAGLAARTVAAASAGSIAALCFAIETREFLERIRGTMDRAHVDAPSRRRALAVVGTAAGLAACLAVAAVAAIFWKLGPLGRLAIAVAIVDLALLPPLVRLALRELPLAWVARRRRRPTEARADATRRPSVVLISIDTLRADRMRALGGRGLMPNLDRLAAAGVLYERAIAQSSWTLPSVASFLTGLHPSRHGAGWALNGFDLLARAPLRSGTWTVAQGLRAAGYRTHAVVANPYLALPFGLAQGFDTYDNVSLESEMAICLRTTLAARLVGPALGTRVSGNGDVVTQRGLRRLRELRAGARDQPYFLWLHYIDPHAPYGCGGDKSFRGDTLLAEIEHDGAELRDRFEAIARLRAGEIRLSPAEKAQMVALYDAGVADVDRCLGEILDAVAPGDDTLIAVVSDHGEEFWEHGGVEHGHTFYDELVRVPLVLAGAGLPRDHRVAELVRLIDLPPTMFDLLHLPAPSDLDGTSMLRPTGAERVALCEGLLFAEDKVAIRTARWKYVRSANGKEELYDLETDRLELRDVAASADLEWARELIAASGAGAPQAECIDDHAADGPAIREALRHLGYA
ncbi:MAG TPA: sulfatase [Candidatus Eisenbacteria bacterium]|nr:sulfatase [Candidatus Eisenbacteria bacterium]